ncbi:MAG TPA: sodium-independent anion transporter [Verrucomicrobiales bacterium]|nr:sodium-independent anion transporter [Verrucomicrobiales bacterium]
MTLTGLFRPKLLETLKGYSRADLVADLLAGVTVGIVALPLAMALGISSGGTAEQGLYTAIIAGFLISALGGSRVQIGGPTAAFLPIVSGILLVQGYNNLLVATLLAGAVLVAMGWARLGVMIKYIPYPVTAGFTSGIAVYILSTQLKDFLGLAGLKMPAEFVGKVYEIGTHLDRVHPPTLILGVVSFLGVYFWPSAWRRRVPPSIVMVILASVVVAALGIQTPTIPEIPRSLPVPHLPALEGIHWGALMRPAFTIALLAAIESLLCAVVADGMIDDRHDSNQELLAQGVANIASALFGGIPATGAIARTGTNVRSGGRTPVAGMVHALTLLGIVLAAAPLAKYVPLATLAAILIVVALNMGEWHHFARLGRWPRSDAIVFLIVFGLTVLTDLTVAVEVGLVLAAVLFIKRVSETTQITSIDERSDHLGPEDTLAGKSVPDGVLVFNLFGAFLFGAADKLEGTLSRYQQPPEVLILGVKRVMAIDATGLNAIEEIRVKLARHGRQLILCGPHTQPLMAMQNHGLLERLGAENTCENLDVALQRAGVILAARKAARHHVPRS